MTISDLGSVFYVDDLDIVTGTGEVIPVNAILPVNVYPNPSEGNIIIDLPYYENVKIRIYNTLGKEVFHTEVNKRKVNIDLSCNTEGLYFIEIDNGFNKQVKKISIK